MISGSAAFNDAVLQGGYPYIARISDNGTVISCNVLSCNIYKGSTGNEAFSVGTVFVPYIEMEVSELSTNLADKELQLEIGVQVSGSTQYITIGYFRVYKLEASTVKTKITALGRIGMLLPTVIIESLTTPTIAEAITAIQTAVRNAGYSNFTISTSGVDTTGGSLEQSFENISCRDLLDIVVSCLGCYATEDNAGNVRLFKYNTFSSLVEYDGDRMIVHPVVYPSDFALTNIKVVKTESYTNEDGEVVPEVAFIYDESSPYNWIISNSYMTEGLFTKFCSNCIGLTYRPATITLAYGDPRIEAQDVLKITDTDGGVYIIPAMGIVHSLLGGLATNIISVGQTEAETIAETKGPVMQQLDKMSSSLLSAQVAAKSAVESAATATVAAAQAVEAAGEAVEAAASASDAATNASNAAQEASNAATSATTYANSALGQLSEVEKVVDVLTWAAKHGTYTITEDTDIISGKYYFIRNGSGTDVDPYVYTVVNDPTGDPHTQGYYELTGVDEAISNYVATHLALTDDGLYVQIDDNACKLQITSTGILLYDAAGVVIAQYGSSIVLGDISGQHIEQTSGELGFYNGSTKVAYISGTELNITSASIERTLNIGVFRWRIFDDNPNRIALVYIGA